MSKPDEFEHEVWGVPPGRRKAVLVDLFDLNRWQWAEKLAAGLRRRGYTEVEVVLAEALPDE